MSGGTATSGGNQAAVEQLRELHAVADGEYRSRAALQLGLVISNYVTELPDDDPRLPGLVEEGLLGLDEGQASAAAVAPIAAVERAKDVLTNRLRPPVSPAPEPTQIRFRPEVLALLGQLDLGMLRSATESMRLVMQDQPPGSPHRVAVESLLRMFDADIVDAVQSGRWKPEHEHVLADLGQLEAVISAAGGSLDPELSALLRICSAGIRSTQYLSMVNSPRTADQPKPTELDEVVADLETVLTILPGTPLALDALVSGIHLRIGFLLLARVRLATRSAGRQDRSWYNNTIRLLRRAQDHLNQAPPTYANQVQLLLGEIANGVATLEQERGKAGDDDNGAGSGPPTPVIGPERDIGPPDSRLPPDPTTSQEPVTEQPSPRSPAEGPGLPSSADLQLMQRAWEGMRLVVSALPDGDPLWALLQAITGMADVADALRSRRWTPEQDRALEKLLQLAERASAGDAGPEPSDMVWLRAGLAMGRGFRCEIMAKSPRSEDWPGAAELSEVVAELETALEMLPQAGPQVGLLAGPMRVMASHLLLTLAGPDSNDHDRAEHARKTIDLQLLARAREHMVKVPPEVFPEADQAVARITRFERLLAGDDPAGDEAESHNASSFDVAEDGGIPWLQAKVDRARQSRDPAEIAATISELRRVRRGLPAGHPEHATMLIWLASLLGRRAALTDSPEDLAEALGAAIEAVREAPPRLAKPAGATLVQMLGGMVTRDQRVGPFEPAEAALSAALTAADPDDAGLCLLLTTGVGAARSLRGRASGNVGTRRLALEAFIAAEKLLPAPEPTMEWLGSAWLLLIWPMGQIMLDGDTEAGALALRMVDRLESILVGNPELAEEMAATAVGGPALPPNLGSGGQGFMQGLQLIKEMLSLMGGSGLLASMLRAREAFQPPPRATAPPPAPASAEQTRRLARRGLDRAEYALGTDRPFGTARRPLDRTNRPDPDLLRAVSTDLHHALAGGLDDDSVRHQINGTLGVCLAELYWLGEPDTPAAPSGRSDQNAADERDQELSRTLLDAINHLDLAWSGSEHTLPTVERATLMDVLARCYRESASRGRGAAARHEADRTARAALRELARCVLVADGTERALETATRANELVARAVGWCLADGRPEAAVEFAEAGRSLVLASVVLAGQVEEVLRGAGEHKVADGWRHGDTPGKLAGLNALWKTRFGDSLLTTPTAGGISAMLVATVGVDGAAYLVPPTANDVPVLDGPAAASDSSAHALVVRPGLNLQIEVVELPGLVTGAGTPLGDYLAAFGAALDAHDPRLRHPEGFRGGPLGQAWADALDELGAWAHARVVGPLVEHTHGWSLDHIPHLVLVPLGELAAVPYAAAWAEDPALPGRRRYAVHDLVLTQAVSARLLGEVARRPRQPLTKRVVLVPDPIGEFPYARATATALVQSLYPGAEVYGRKRAPNGPASTERLLAALPGRDKPGASLLHLSTHATTEPTARLQTADGWLALSRILEQARGRPPDSASGLVITNACLTDSTRSHYDESVTLATALLAAGAAGVIGTRWPIDDDTTAVLVYHLHHRLTQGHPPAHALRLAQLDLLDPDSRPRPGLHPHLAALPHARLAHPASWAGYTYHGT